MNLQFEPENLYLVTGASSGLGKATALFLNSLGATVVAVARNEEKLTATKNESNYPKKFFTHCFDFGDLENISGFIKTLVSEHGKFTGLVHSAGIGGVTPLKSLDLDDAKKMFDINYFSGLILAKSFADKRICQPPASLVFLSSISSISGNAGISNYSASKGAINALVKSLAVELAKNNIRVNAVLPGFIVTDIVNASPDVYNEAFFEKVAQDYPLGSGLPEDVAHLVAFLLSPLSRWITGQNIVIDGGRTLL
jgi:NAD(P)-dependent dehydrogenase (short-subunit alcohol dehydrogenase family)